MNAAALEQPLRAAGVELLGPVRDMAYAEERWLICAGGARYMQATPLLYHVLEHADGHTPAGDIAAAVGALTDRVVTADDVRALVADLLAPAGLVVDPEAPAAPAVAQAPALGVRWRVPLLRYSVTRGPVQLLHHLYAPALLVPLALGGLAVDAWVLFQPQLARGIVAVAYQPWLMLVLAAIEIGTRLWHELGHASALRRAGAAHGTIGFAIYMVLPVFYTDVSHAYRLSRWQRVRVDLGGIYFDLITSLVLFAIYAATGWTPLLLAMLLITFGIFEQFTPFLRFDGYYLFADLVGVHEPLTLVGTFLGDLLPWNWGRRPLVRLPRWAGWLLAGYGVMTAAFLARPAIILAAAGGPLLAALPASAGLLWEHLSAAWTAGDAVGVAAWTLQLLTWTILPAGLLLMAWTLLRALARGASALAARVRHQPGSRPLPTA